MQLLKRTPRTIPMDEYLSSFTSVEAAEFRRLVGSAFARAGRDVTIRAEHVVDRTGTVFGLRNIAALCRGVARREWREVIDDHVRTVTTPPRDLSDLSDDELRAGLHLQLAASDSVPDPDTLRYARQAAPGLLEVLSVDLPDSVVTLREDDRAAPGTLGELMELGRANLRSLLDGDGVEAVAVANGRDVSYTEVSGTSFFTASLALLLPETVQRFSGESDWGRGVLVAVPHRHLFLYRVVDGRSTRPTLRHMFMTARRAYHAAAGPLSPDVYWVRERRWVPVTSVEGGRARVLVRGGRYPT
jgi:hypothetical protein